jgi:hypothetical protein
MPPIGLQRHLNNFQFERTIDWRISFPNLSLLDESLKNSLLIDGGWCLAKSVNLPVSLIDVEADDLIGFYRSKIIVPTLTTEIYVDSEGIIENALRLWNLASFTIDGFMPTYVSPKMDGQSQMSDLAVQEIIVNRINPINETKAVAMLRKDATNIEKAEKEEFGASSAIEEYKFRGYLAKIPDYAGSSSASIRTLTLDIKIIHIERTKAPMSSYRKGLCGGFFFR